MSSDGGGYIASPAAHPKGPGTWRGYMEYSKKRKWGMGASEPRSMQDPPFPKMALNLYILSDCRHRDAPFPDGPQDMTLHRSTDVVWTLLGL